MWNTYRIGGGGGGVGEPTLFEQSCVTSAQANMTVRNQVPFVVYCLLDLFIPCIDCLIQPWGGIGCGLPFGWLFPDGLVIH